MTNTTIEGNIVFPDGTKYGQISFSGDRIGSIELNKTKFISGASILDEKSFICPGFIELQINGGFGKEFKSDMDALNHVAGGLYKYGTTSFCPTITTMKLENYLNHINTLLSQYTKRDGTKVLGFHLEGPALNPKKSGAQNADLCIEPKDILLDDYVNEHVKIVTFAPELLGSKEFISKLVKRNIKVGVGHSLITYDELDTVFDHENMWIVHIFNAMEALKSREPGVVGYGLNSPAYIGLIADKIHLNVNVVEIVWKLKSKKIISVSDGSAVTGLSPGTYEIGSRTMIKTDERVTLPNGTLVGSILTQNIAVKNLVEITNCEIHDAINTVSLNPATFLGIENEIGQIKEGNLADLCILDHNFNVTKVFIDGIEKNV